MKTRITALAAIAALALSAMVATAGPSQALGTCNSIGEFSPKTVIVGLSIVKVDFTVATPGCAGGWQLNSDVFSLSEGPSSVAKMAFHPGFNSVAGAHDVQAYLDVGNDFLIYRDWVKGFHLLRRTQWNSFNASPEPVKAGRTITVTGKLVRANWDLGKYYAYSGQPVLVQFRTTKGAYSTVKALRTDSKGWVKTGFKAKKTGVWRLKYAGNTVSGPTAAYGDVVKVR